MRKVHPEDTATGLSPNRYKQSELCSCLVIILRWPETVYVLMMLYTRGGKMSSLLCGDFKDEHIFKSWKAKKKKKSNEDPADNEFVNFSFNGSESARFIFVMKSLRHFALL